jgi:hypothetical protein
MSEISKPEKDAFNQWWERETKGTVATAYIYDAAMLLTPEERMDPTIFNEAVRTQMGQQRPAVGADQYGVPTADERARRSRMNKKEQKGRPGHYAGRPIDVAS